MSVGFSGRRGSGLLRADPASGGRRARLSRPGQAPRRLELRPHRRRRVPTGGHRRSQNFGSLRDPASRTRGAAWPLLVRVSSRAVSCADSSIVVMGKRNENPRNADRLPQRRVRAPAAAVGTGTEPRPGSSSPRLRARAWLPRIIEERRFGLDRRQKDGREAAIFIPEAEVCRRIPASALGSTAPTRPRTGSDGPSRAQGRSAYRQGRTFPRLQISASEPTGRSGNWEIVKLRRSV
jgi:hypothetical protein